MDTITQFQASLVGLKLDTEGLQPRANTVEQLNHVSAMALETITVTADAKTPYELLARELAVLTCKLVTTALMPGSPQLLKSWLLARAQLFELHVRSHTQEELE